MIDDMTNIEWPDDLPSYDELTPLGRAAADYMYMGLGVIPLRRGEKIPAINNWTEDYSNNPPQAAIWWNEKCGGDPYGNVGVVCGEASGGLVYIDVDRHGEMDGTESLKKWTEENGNLPETVVQQTGGGGYGFLYLVDRPIATTAAPSIGIDIRGEGGQFVAPPSVHPNGNAYEWVNSPEDFDYEIPRADETVYKLLEWIQSRAGGGSASKRGGGVKTGNGGGGRFELPATIPNGARNDTLTRYGFSLRARWADEDTIYNALHDANRARCVEPLDDSEIDVIVVSVCKKAPGVSGVTRPAPTAPTKAVPTEAVPALLKTPSQTISKDLSSLGGQAPIKTPAQVLAGEDSDAEAGVDTTTEDAEEGNFKGVYLLLDVPYFEPAEPNRRVTTGEILERLCNDPQTRNIKYDVYSKEPLKVGPIVGDQTDEVRTLEDPDLNLIWTYAELAYGATSRKKFDDAFDAMLGLRERRYDKIADALSELPTIKHAPEGDLISWDGGDTWEHFTPVAGTLFQTYLKATPGEYTQEAEKVVLRNIIGRATHPGCKSEIVAIFQGPQGIGKSQLSKLLALNEGLYTPSFNKFDKDGCMKLCGQLVVELAELAAFNFTRMEEIKSQVSVPFDRFRSPYKHLVANHPRTCVFIGTTNDSTFLRDQTGGRRWHVIECGGEEEHPDPRLYLPVTDEASAARAVRQAYAEILDELNTVGWEEFKKLMIPSPDLQVQAREVRERYTTTDYLLEDVEAWLDENHLIPGTRVCVKQAFMEAYDLEDSDWSKVKNYDKTNMSNAMDRCPRLRRLTGASNYRVSGYGHPTKVWEVVFPHDDEDDEEDDE